LWCVGLDKKKEVKNEIFFSRVDIELINEQVRLFYSALDEVAITFDNDSFKIVEYVSLGFQDNYKYYPLEETIIKFHDNANYSINTTLVFVPPEFDKIVLHHIYNANNTLLTLLKKNVNLTLTQESDLHNLPATYLLCYLNGFDEAIDKLNEAKPYLKAYKSSVYIQYKESLRILRKVKYN